MGCDSMLTSMILRQVGRDCNETGWNIRVGEADNRTVVLRNARSLISLGLRSTEA
jgi:hypothetical protein